jgi:hypothetical protein
MKALNAIFVNVMRRNSLVALGVAWKIYPTENY